MSGVIKKLKSVLLLTALFLIAGLTSSMLSTKPALAASIPLDPGCYYRTGVGEYEPRDCPSSDYDRAVSTRNTCFVTRSSGSYVFFEISCVGPGLDLVGSYNGPRAQRVCEALRVPHVWVEEDLACHYGGSQCREIMVAGGVYDYSTCQEHIGIEDIFGRYLRNELPLDSQTPVNPPSPPAAPTPPTTVVPPRDPLTPAEPVEQLSPEVVCGNSGGDWIAEEQRCVHFQVTNDCQTGVEDESGQTVTELNRDNCQIVDYLVIGINVLSVLAGLSIVFSFIWVGYLYITARDNPQFVAQAKDRIFWTLIALALFLFMYSILNWLVPGGLLPG